MSKIFKIIFATLTILSGFFLSLATPTYAADSNDTICDNEHISQDFKDAAGCNEKATDQLPTIITGILNAIIASSGIVAVVFIIIGGINYMTSAGDSTKVEKAKKTILYACIGLIVCVLAFAIVNWVRSAIQSGEKYATSQYTTPKSCENAGYTWKNNKCK